MAAKGAAGAKAKSSSPNAGGPRKGGAGRAVATPVIATLLLVGLLAACAHRPVPPASPTEGGQLGSGGNASPGSSATTAEESAPESAGSPEGAPRPPLDGEPLVPLTRTSLKQARRALMEGRRAEAYRIYRAILETTPRGDERRSEALYWVGMLKLSPDPTMRDVGRGRTMLKDLVASAPGWERAYEASIALTLLDRVDAERAAGEALEARRAEAALATENCLNEKQDMDGTIDAGQAEIKALQTQVAARRAEADGLREELRRKDEALKKVKEAVVGWKPSR